MISLMSAEKVTEDLMAWADAFDPDFASCLHADPEMTKAILSIGRGGKKPRKDFANWKDAKYFIQFFFDPYFAIEEPITEFSAEDIKKVLDEYLACYDPADDANAWFDKVKKIAEQNGYCTNMKEYKLDPTGWKGSIGDVSTFLRVALTGRKNSPDLYTVISILGAERASARIRAYENNL